MSAFSYYAKRNLAAGHVVDTLYSIDVRLADIQEARKVERKDHRSISGKQESVFRRIEKTIKVKTVPIPESSELNAYIEEMIDSVAGGEVLTFDRWGSVAVPDQAVSVTLDISGISDTRIKGIRHRQYGFKLRLAL